MNGRKAFSNMLMMMLVGTQVLLSVGCCCV
jgi:hypothetical protein